MIRAELLDRVTRTLAELFELDAGSITMKSRLVEDLDLDSIDAIDLAVKLQELTGRRLEEDDMRRIRTVADIVDVLEGMLASDS